MRFAALIFGALLGWLGAELRYGHHLPGPRERVPEPEPETPAEKARRERGFVSQTQERPPDFGKDPGKEVDERVERPRRKHRG